MRTRHSSPRHVLVVALALLLIGAGAIGDFQDHRDVGVVTKAGTAAYDKANRQYTVTAGGENIWATKDAFHFVWRKMSGDVDLSAAVRLVRVGDKFTITVTPDGQAPTEAGPVTVELHDPVYAGLAVSAHDAAATETAVFSNVELKTPATN